MSDGYDEFMSAPSQGDSSELGKMIELMWQAEAEVEKAEQVLKTRRASLEDFATRQIPELMLRMNVSEFVNAAGIRVTLKNHVSASIPEERREEAFAWLEEQGHGGLIKRTVSVAFAKGQEESANELLTELSGDYPGNVVASKKIEAQTLKAFVTKQIEAGNEIPKDVFGVSEFRRAKVEQKKK